MVNQPAELLAGRLKNFASNCRPRIAWAVPAIVVLPWLLVTFLPPNARDTGLLPAARRRRPQSR